MAGFLGIAGGGGGVVGGAVVRLTLDVSKFDAGLAGAQGKLASAASKMTAIGGNLTKFVTLPIVAIGGVATKMALDFEQAFTRIAAVTNTSESEIANLKQSVLDLAGETARAPQELAEALYFLSSAGLSASQVTETLELSAKAAAVGLGETQDIARLTANALNAYADSGLTAAEVTDTLVAAIREGTAEPQEFADALGRILPIASAAGVEFDEVAASLAVLSNVGLDVNEGVTAMRGLLQAMVAPGSAAADAMNELGISTEQMRQVLSEGGLLAAMQLLMDASGGNLDVLQDIIPNVRSLTGELGIMGQDAEQVAGIFDRVTNATGDLSDSFGTTAEGPAFKMQQALAELKVSLIQLGEIILPIATDIIQWLSGVAEAFSNLAPGTQKVIVQVGLLVAAIGPLLIIGGKMIGMAINMGKAFAKIGTGGFTWAGAGVIALTALAAAFAASKIKVELWAASFEESLRKGSTSLEMLTQQAEAANQASDDTIGDFWNFQDAVGAVGRALGILPDQQKAVLEAQEALDAEINIGKEALKDMPGGWNATRAAMIKAQWAAGNYSGALQLLTTWINESKAAQDAATAAFHAHRDAITTYTGDIQDATGAAHGIIAAEEGLIAPTEAATGPLTDQAAAAQADADAMAAATAEAYNLINAQLQLAGGFLGVLGASNSLADAQANLADVQSHLNDTNKDTKTSTADLEAAQLSVLQAQLGLTGSVESYTQSLIDQGIPQKDIIALLKDQGAKAGLTAQQVQGLIDKVNKQIDVNEQVPKAVQTKYTTPGLDAATSGAANLSNVISGIDRFIEITFQMHTIGSVAPGLQQFESGGVLHTNLMAAGGVKIPTGASGLMTTGPTLVGEGNYPTRFGTGAEWVQPLTDHMLRRLATAIDDVRNENGGGYKGGGDDVATAVERGMGRVMQNWVWNKEAQTVVLQIDSEVVARVQRRREALRS